MDVTQFDQSVIIVTGLPRSGTSLLMAALQAGGLAIVQDHQRRPDQHNPRGYFEDARVKDMAQDSGFVEQCCGRALKVVYRFLPYLPSHLTYKVFWMERDLEEVLASQRTMLGQQIVPPGLREALRVEVDRSKLWLNRQSHLEWWEIPHRGLLLDPPHWLQVVSKAIDRPLDQEAMKAEVDVTLYRQRLVQS